MKILKELRGVKILSKTEQKTIAGGVINCSNGVCPYPLNCCMGKRCQVLPCEIE